jgi:hexosaminidase
MKTIFVATSVLLATFLKAPAAELHLIPWPAQVQQRGGQFTLNKQTAVVADGAFTNEAAFLAEKLQIACAKSATENRILLTPAPAAGGDGESYRLEVGARGVTIEAPSSAGVFYGCQTLRQLIDPATQAIPFVKIEDAPRYAWRGLMLDVSRHFFDTSTVLALLDQMADYKLNRFHLHLTDDTGWRLEIGKYPELTRIGATGDYSDTNAPARYFTRAEVQAILARAEQRHIVVVPEIDMPGHAGAATRSLPQLDGGRHTFNPVRQETYEFLQDVLLETMALFPSPWIHFGGDEVDCSRWKLDSAAVSALSAEELKTGEQVEAAFARRMAAFIKAQGRTPMGWDDTVAARPESCTVIYWWRHDKPERLLQALAEGHPVVMAPRSPFYFDYPQDRAYPQNGWKLVNTPAAVYRGPGIPTNIPPAQLRQILGVEACVWTEHIASVPYLQFMTLPRMAALAEEAWTPDNQRSYAKFNHCLAPFLARYRERDIHCYVERDPLGSLHDARVFEPASAPRAPSKDRSSSAD